MTETVKRLTLRIPVAAYAVLETAARNQGVNETDLIREAIANYLTRHGIPMSVYDLQIGQHGGWRGPSQQGDPMDRIMQAHPEKLLDGMKTAILAPASPKDGVYTAGEWTRGLDGHLGQSVEAVRLMGAYEYAVGDRVAVYGPAAPDGPPMCYVVIEHIALVDCDALTADQHAALALTTTPSSRWGWYMPVRLATDLPDEPPSRRSGPSEIKVWG